MASVEALKKELAASNKELLFYQQKVKDVVQAYKNLDAEKKAMEKAVNALKTVSGDSSGSETDTSIANLKDALAELSTEGMKKEQAFIADKKALMEEVEKQKAKAAKLAAQFETQQEQVAKGIKFAEKYKALKQSIREMDANREIEIQDHGSVLAEMQKRYAAEKSRADKLQKELNETGGKAGKEATDALVNAQKRQTELEGLVEKLRTELDLWKGRASITPTTQNLQKEVEQLKSELAAAGNQAQAHAQVEAKKEEQRRQDLENRLVALSEQAAISEQRAHEAEEQTKESRRRIQELEAKIGKLGTEGPVGTSENLGDLEKNLKELVSTIRSKKPDIDVYEIVGAKRDLQQQKLKYERLEDEYEKYKLRAEAILRSKQNTQEDENDREESGLRNLVSQLHEKLRNLEISAATDRVDHEQTARSLKERITELESGEEKLMRDMRAEMSAKISDMEQEIQKQRNRTLELLTEKEKELEATRSILVSVRSEQLQSSPPRDPHQKTSVVKKRSTGEPRYVERRKSSGFRHRSTDSVASGLDYTAETSSTHIPLTNESRNIYYEELVAKKNMEINELRSLLHSQEYRVKEAEQNNLTRDIQHKEMSERLKEEIRTLEGKVTLLSGENGREIEYLRNIFVQLVQKEDPIAKKQIFKAMGMCLKLSPNEMKAIEKKNF
ncbi:unnamed protein product, partial [Mesorhabditis spiculigera]